MAGVPGLAYDFGDNCMACSAINPLTPKSFRCVFTGIKKTGDPGFNFDLNKVATQLFFGPCLYNWQQPPFPQRIFFQYAPVGGIPNTSYVAIEFVSPQFDMFRATGIAGCLLAGTVENDYTELNPAPFGHYGGTCTFAAE